MLRLGDDLKLTSSDFASLATNLIVLASLEHERSQRSATSPSPMGAKTRLVYDFSKPAPFFCCDCSFYLSAWREKICQSDGRSDWPTVGTQRNMPRYRQPTHAPQPGVRWRRWLAARCEAEAAARGRAAPALVIARLLHLHLPPRHPGAVDLSDLDTSGDRVGTQDTGCTHGVTGHPGAVDMSGMHGQRRWTRRL